MENGQAMHEQLQNATVLMAQYQGRLAAAVEDRFSMIQTLHAALQSVHDQAKRLVIIRDVRLVAIARVDLHNTA